MEHISIFNYEAYYLDYLEGNLSEEDTALLFEFLEQHPECKLDDEDLQTFNPEELKLDQSIKDQIKQVDEEEMISAENLDYFLISQSEGVISDEKEQELEAFIVSNDLQKEKELTAATYFVPNPAEVYAHKDGLKQAVQFVLWPYVAAAASVLILVMVYMFGAGSDVVGSGDQVMANNSEKQESTQIEQSNGNEAVQAEYNGNETPGLDNVEGEQPYYAEEQPNNRQTPVAVSIDNPISNEKLANLPVRRVLSPNATDKPEPLAAQIMTSTPSTSQSESQDYASVHFSGMSNPIEPITKAISERTNTEIDFRSGKSKTDESKGFFLKIGKFEVSRKKH